jgi:hypothetical protein
LIHDLTLHLALTHLPNLNPHLHLSLSPTSTANLTQAGGGLWRKQYLLDLERRVKHGGDRNGQMQQQLVGSNI